MELDELRQAWGEQARKLDRILSLNLQGFKTAQVDKTRSALGRLKLYLLFELLIGLFLLLASGSYLADHFSVLTLSIPALIFAASALVAVVGDIRELALLGQINYADPVTAIQRKLEAVALHFLRMLRLMVFMLPLYLVYVVLGLNLLFGWDILAHGNGAFLWANLAVSLILIAPATWVFRNLSLNNIDHPVIHALVQGSGGKQIITALEFLKALQDFENEEQAEMSSEAGSSPQLGGPSRLA